MQQEDGSCADPELLEGPAIRICRSIFAPDCCSAGSLFQDEPEPGEMTGERR